MDENQEPEGWRISGIGVTLTGTEDALVLDFENAASIQAAIDAATGQTAAPNEGNQPAANQSTGVAGASTPGLPELPSYPNGATLEAAPTQQIVLPSINGAPIIASLAVDALSPTTRPLHQSAEHG